MTLGGHAPPSAVVGVTIALTTLAGLVAVARLITRAFIVRMVGLDDVCITVAMILTVGITITMIEQVHYGMGRRDYMISEHDDTMSLKWFWASVWIYYLALCFTKLSILLQYLRVFPHSKFRVACYTLIAVVIIYSCCTFFTTMFACTPIAYFWNKDLRGTCLNETAVWFVNAGINIATDISTAILPLPVLNTLTISRRQKLLLMAIFGLGGFTCIISILRLNALYVVSHTKDISWNNPLAAIWSSTEVNVGILCSCLPTLKGLICKFWPHLFGPPGSMAASFRLRQGSGGNKAARHVTDDDGDASHAETVGDGGADGDGDGFERGGKDLTSMGEFLRGSRAPAVSGEVRNGDEPGVPFKLAFYDFGKLETGYKFSPRNSELPRRDSEILNPGVMGLSPVMRSYQP